jgi:2-octaprenyl-3-methyl-6-methoxy-1,4-benzoquinol hydroxylase/2-octaprenylphenol hydroxylase
VLFVRSGKQIGQECIFPKHTKGKDTTEVLSAFLPLYYLGIESSSAIEKSRAPCEFLSHTLVSVKAYLRSIKSHTSISFKKASEVGVRDLAGIEFSENDYQQKAIVCNIRSNKDFENTTWQRFLSASIIALLPLSHNEASIVWSAENHLADELLALSPEAFAKRLSAGVEVRFGEFEILSEIQAFPLIERSAKDYVKENLALIGDAAHNIHPLAGQGVNLGFSDVVELSQQLNTNNKLLGDYLVLRKYARARRLDNELMAKTMSGLNWIYKENNEPLRWLRGFGMNLINENSMFKSFFQKYATGSQ